MNVDEPSISATAPMPAVSVIIPTFRDWDALAVCLDHLAAQTLAPDRFEIIVANNNPEPTLPGSVSFPPNARVVHEPKPGSYTARNTAIAAARAPVLAFTDSDCRPLPHWLEAGLAALSQLGPIDRVGGAITLVPKGAGWTTPELYDRLFYLLQREYVEELGWGTTANLFVRRAAFDVAGPFRQEFFSGEDRGWNYRARDKGSRIAYAPDAEVLHPARDSFSVLASKRKRLTGAANQRRQRRPGLRGSFHMPLHFLLPPSKGSLRPILQATGLTPRERRSLKWLHYRLQVITFFETMRLHYFRGAPRR